MRVVATTLVDPAREIGTRAIVGEKIDTPSAGGFKAFLALALLEEIDPERPRDFGRDATV